jgi:hypothetical protein
LVKNFTFLNNYFISIYRIYIIFAQNYNAMNIITRKRKIIDIPEDTFRNLSIMAAAEGKSLKSFIEKLLISEAKLVSDEDIYRELIKSDKEGKIIASEEEQKLFEKWLEE